jgi:hypothetical protein
VYDIYSQPDAPANIKYLTTTFTLVINTDSEDPGSILGQQAKYPEVRRGYTHPLQ